MKFRDLIRNLPFLGYVAGIGFLLGVFCGPATALFYLALTVVVLSTTYMA
jgi:hypothetical protein